MFPTGSMLFSATVRNRRASVSRFHYDLDPECNRDVDPRCGVIHHPRRRRSYKSSVLLIGLFSFCWSSSSSIFPTTNAFGLPATSSSWRRGTILDTSNRQRLPHLQQKALQSTTANDDDDDDGSSSKSQPPSMGLERTAAHLEKLLRRQQQGNDNNSTNEQEDIYRYYIEQPASELKRLLSARGYQQSKGRKPDLARRLMDDDLETKYGVVATPTLSDNRASTEADPLIPDSSFLPPIGGGGNVVTEFATLAGLSQAASQALTHAQIHRATRIQSAAMAQIYRHRASCILHAATGSGTSEACACLSVV